MRLAAAVLIAFAASLGLAAAQEKTPEAQQVPSTGAGTPARSPQNGAPHPGNAAAHPDQQRQGEQTLQSKSGQGGKEEPSTKPAAVTQEPPFVNGKLNAPGAPADSQTVPAKFSERNAEIDKKPILGFLGFTDEQRSAIAAAVKGANAPVASSDAKVAEELPHTIALQELPPALHNQMPEMRDLKYIRVDGRILLVYAPNNFVVAEIKN